MIEGRRILTAIGKQPVGGAVAVNALGLEGDEQADLSVHGGLDKAVYAYPSEHLALWQAARQERGLDLFDAPLGTPTMPMPYGAVGENLSLQGLLESDVWVGDELHFPDCVLRVTAPREPCYKFNAVMGYAQASRDMVQTSCCGFYLAVQQAGTIEAGQRFSLVPGRRALLVAEAFQARRIKHLR
jgi:MOSC domain-containing protein YiiM